LSGTDQLSEQPAAQQTESKNLAKWSGLKIKINYLFKIN